MSLAGYVPFTVASLSPAHLPNATASLPSDWRGRAGWFPPGAPPPNAVPRPTAASSPSSRRRRRRKRVGAWASEEGGWMTEDGSSLDGGRLGRSVRLNASFLEDFFTHNLTEEDKDYVMNMSISKGGVLPWGGSGGVVPNGYPLNLGHHKNGTAFGQQHKKKDGKESDELCYCPKSNESLLRRVANGYRRVHAVAALTVCAFGTIANALNVAVLTRPHLAPAPVNRILTAIAAADAALMADYAAYAIIVRLPQSKAESGGSTAQSPTMTPAEEAAKAEKDYTFASAAFVLFHVHLSQVLHTVSICLTLTLAVWRYLALRMPPEKARILCSRRRCTVALAVSVLLPPLLCSPSYLLFGIATTRVHMGQQHPVAAAHGDPTLPPNDNYTLEQGLMIPTLAITSLNDEDDFNSDGDLPLGASAAPRQMAWGAAYPVEVEEEGDREWETTTTPPHHLHHYSSSSAFSSPSWAATSPYPNRTTETPSLPPPAVAVLYHVVASDVAKGQGEILYIVNFWVYAVILKLLPCLVLTVISVCLVRTLYRAKSRRRALQNQADVKKAAQGKAVPIYKWKKNEEKVVLASTTARAPPHQPPETARREKPLDDGGVWMGREETSTKEGEAEEEPEDGVGGSVEGMVEEEAATLVQDPSSRAEEGEVVCVANARGTGGSKREWWPGWLSVRRKRKTSDGNVAGCVAAQQQEAVATVGAAVRRRRRRTERTTRMLVAVLILFLVTEFPQGVLGLLSGLLGRCFFKNCYQLFGDLMDLLALLNGSINFILYCAMSRQFRQTFAQLFCKHPKLLWTSLCKSCPFGHKNSMELMKNGNMGGDGLRKGATTFGGQPSHSMGEVQSTYV